MTTLPVATGAKSDLAEVLVAALERAQEPLPLTKLAAQLPPSFKKAKNRFEPLLGDLVAQGRLHRFSPFGGAKGPRFWTRDASIYARELTVQLLRQKGPLGPSDLWKGVQSRLKDWSRERFSMVLGAMIQDARIRELPALPRARSRRLSLQPPQPREYLEKTFEQSVFGPVRKIIDVLRQEGVPADQLLEEVNAAWRVTLAKIPALADVTRTSIGETAGGIDRLSPDEKDQKADANRSTVPNSIVQGIIAMKPNAAQGAMVALPDLRRHLRDAFPTKEPLDAAVLQMAAEGRVDLHRHTFPANLDEHEKAALVTDGKGNYYMGIVLRS